MDKIEIIDGYDGFERKVTGTVKINGDIYNWELETDDGYHYNGFTSIYINKEENLIWDNRSFVEASLECDEDLDMYGISEEDGEEVYDEILTYVNDNGYGFIGEEFE